MNYINALDTLEIYRYHSLSEPVIKKINAGELIEFNREKRREGINWMEVYLPNGDMGYILKENSKLFVCKHVELSDENVTGFDYVLKDKTMHFNEVFKPVKSNIIMPTDVGEPEEGKKRIKVSRLIDSEKEKSEMILLDYDPELADVTTFTLEKEETFYVTKEGGKYSGVFTEINSMDGKKGYILHTTSYTELKDKWMMPVIIIVMVLTIIGIVAAFYESGWIVMSTLFIIPAVIVGFIVIILLKIIIAILEGIFNQIRKRF